jgi:capsular exopolysaccharide synthesis family protein
VELADYMSVVRRRWWMVALALVICVLGSGAFSLMQSKIYTSSLTLLVPTGSVANAQSRVGAIDAAAAYAQFATTVPAIEAALGAANVGRTAVSVQATVDGTSPVLVITAASSEAAAAQRVAQAYLQVLPQIVVLLEKAPNADPPEFTVLEAAKLPDSPASPKPFRNMLIGAALGLVLGSALAVLRESLDGRVRDGVQLERAADVTLLGLVPKEFRSVLVPAVSRPKSRRAEAYRAVRTNLEFLSVNGMPRSIVVTSAYAGEGKSSLSVNLGVVASRAGRNVVIIDADLRKPTLATYFGLDSPIGLTDVIMGRWSVDEALQQIPGERLWLLSSGPIPAAPGELVGSMAMATLLEELEDRFDFVIVDTPPVLPVSDGLSIAVNVEGVVLVTKMRETTRRSVQKAAEAIRKVNASLVGVVGNIAVANGEDALYGYGDGYRSRSKINVTGERDIAEEIQPLAAAGRRRREAHVDEVPRTRRERRRGETRGTGHAASSGPSVPSIAPDTAPRGLPGLIDVRAGGQSPIRTAPQVESFTPQANGFGPPMTLNGHRPDPDLKGYHAPPERGTGR